MWGACLPISDDAAVSDYLGRERRLAVSALEDAGLARALPVNGWLPSWARCRGQSWRETHHRLIVPMFGPSGLLESLHARTLVPSPDYPKGLSPAGASVRGLVMADALGRLMLADRPLADGEPASAFVSRVGLVLTEGVPDYLTWGSVFSDANESAPAVLGLISGSFTPEIAARIPDGCRIAVRRHADSAGEKYTNAIVSALSSRCRVHVFNPSERV